MKRILSLVLALVLVLGSVPMTFAADQSAGDMLKAAGFVAGDQDGNLNEDQSLTREQMMVLIAEMNGVKEEAATFSIPADFSDVQEDDWFAPYVWYAFYQGWTAGMGDGSFGAGVAVDSKMAATFMLKALDYEVTDYNASVEQAADLGIEIVESDMLTRGEGFDAMWSTVNLPKQGSDVALGVELGKIEEEAPAVVELDVELDEVSAIGTKVVEVIFTDDVDADAAEAADLTIVKKGTSEELDVERIQAVASDRVYVYTEEMKSGTALTAVLGESTYNFTAVDKETDKPEVDSVSGVDTNLVEVEFDSNVDFDTATDVANYSIDKEGTVVAATVKDDNKTVELTLDGITKRQSLKMTVENVLNVDGVMMDKEIKTFYPDEDKDAPKIDEVNPDKLYNNAEVVIYFDDEHGVDKATAEDVANYAIEGVEIIKAEADDVVYDTSATNNEADSDYYGKVTLTTSGMKENTKYEVKVLYMVDGSTSANATTDTLEEDFRSGSEDDTEPSVTSVDALSETVVKVTFSDKNYLDPASALDLSNYDVEDDELSIYDVQFKDDDDEEMIVYLTVSRMDPDERNYKLLINNIADKYGNAMDDEEKKSFDLKGVNYNGASAIESITVVDLDELKVTFSDSVKTDSAEDPTNYIIDGEGAALEAEFVSGSDTVVTLKVNELKNNKTYTLKVDGVENFADQVTDGLEMDFIATSDEQDTTRPEVTDVDVTQEDILLVGFDESMSLKGTTWSSGVAGLASAAAPTNIAYAIVEATASENSSISVGDQFAIVAAGQTDDDETVIFNAYQGLAYTAATKTFGAVTTFVTTDGDEVQFDIVEFVGLTDEAGNTPNYDEDDESFEVDEKYVLADDAVEYDSAAQEGTDEVYVYFDEPVRIVNTAATMSIYDDVDEDEKVSAGDTVEYTVDYDDDDDDETLIILGLTAADYFKEDQELVFNGMSADIADMIGRPVATEHVQFDTDDVSDEEPEIDSVVAINDTQIEVTWSLDLDSSYGGGYEITNDDDDDWNSNGSTTSYSSDVDDNVVTLTLSSSDLLNVTDDFTLTLKRDAKSLYGESSDLKGEEYGFAGSSTPYTGDTVTGVKAINGTTFEIVEDDDFTNYAAMGTNGGGDELEGIAASDSAHNVTYVGDTISSDNETITVTVKEYTPFIDDVEYTITMDLDSSRNVADTSAVVVGYVQGTVEYLEDAAQTGTGSTTGASIVLDIPGLDDDEDNNYVLYLLSGSTEVAAAFETDENSSTAYTVTGSAASYVTSVSLDGDKATIVSAADLSSYDAVVVVKNGDNVIAVSKKVTLQ